MNPALAAFQRAFRAFEEAKLKMVEIWPTIFRDFEDAFKAARHDRAATTPRLNILDVFGLKNWELCHSRALAWFLDENASHEQGGVFMHVLLRFVGIDLGNCEDYSVQREKPDRVDVVAYKPREFAVFIENKVDHHERELQLADLQESLISFSERYGIPESQRIAVFLTDDGRKPETAHLMPLSGFFKDNLYPIRRLDLFEGFGRALSIQDPKSPLLVLFLQSYIDAINNH